ncbi:uncharacterized protein K452DRAFT_233712 [Aplosporella prunicola CBS 121167]|uniref:NAD(P)-binding domain-containing protein n=1 Tax=Aplosporella prunicola CBS 121167 TaxID=1176127 RepID=A0A6A6B7R7_9PEZI|nr:uncharacterized protein K452DRAFT_233712 [Aplosporella prunicola CBS 121167]KAF2138831.1 hypothetical protein K452DRAFT_233712 [Aplosporella prunicola CBS 121167]
MTSPTPIKYLITGATGGLGQGVLFTFLSNNVPHNSIAAGVRRSGNPAITALGVQERIVDFDASLETLRAAFAGVDTLLFVSSSEIDNAKRAAQHRTVVDAAKEARVQRVWYTSLGLGGGEGEIELMVVHRQTEEMLRESNLTWTSVREALYTDAFPCLVNWYPTDPHQTLHLPCDGSVAFALRDELAEATAKLMLKGGHENEIIDLTGPTAIPLTTMISTINRTTSRAITVSFVSDAAYIALNSANDEGRKPAAFFRNWVTLLRGIEAGRAAVVSPLMEEALGRRPLSGLEGLEKLLSDAGGDYIWHQNYAT